MFASTIGCCQRCALHVYLRIQAEVYLLEIFVIRTFALASISRKDWGWFSVTSWLWSHKTICLGRTLRHYLWEEWVSTFWLVAAMATYAQQAASTSTFTNPGTWLTSRNDRACDRAANWLVPIIQDKQLWTNRTWVEGIKALPASTITESASAPHLAPGVCVIDSAPSYLLPQRPSWRLRAKTTTIPWTHG